MFFFIIISSALEYTLKFANFTISTNRLVYAIHLSDSNGGNHSVHNRRMQTMPNAHHCNDFFFLLCSADCSLLMIVSILFFVCVRFGGIYTKISYSTTPNGKNVQKNLRKRARKITIDTNYLVHESNSFLVAFA